jgi:curved DNA-binding protein CbpA
MDSSFPKLKLLPEQKNQPQNSKNNEQPNTRTFNQVLGIESPSTSKADSKIPNVAKNSSTHETNQEDYSQHFSENLYQILGVSRTATQEDIKKAYHKIAKELKHQVDRKKDKRAEEALQSINHAYGILKDSQKRYRYDSPHLNINTGSKDYPYAKPNGTYGPQYEEYNKPSWRDKINNFKQRLTDTKENIKNTIDKHIPKWVQQTVRAATMVSLSIGMSVGNVTANPMLSNSVNAPTVFAKTDTTTAQIFEQQAEKNTQTITAELNNAQQALLYNISQIEKNYKEFARLREIQNNPAFSSRPKSYQDQINRRIDGLSDQATKLATTKEILEQEVTSLQPQVEDARAKENRLKVEELRDKYNQLTGLLRATPGLVSSEGHILLNSRTEGNKQFLNLTLTESIRRPDGSSKVSVQGLPKNILLQTLRLKLERRQAQAKQGNEDNLQNRNLQNVKIQELTSSQLLKLAQENKIITSTNINGKREWVFDISAP